MLQSMDEMIELFSVLNQLEKGALGLFFEMNYFVGVCLSIYISWFILSFEPPVFDPKIKTMKKALGTGDISQTDFDDMYNWLYFHWIYLFISLVLSFAVFMIYHRINGKLSTSNKDEKGSKVN